MKDKMSFDETVREKTTMRNWKLFWSPTGECIGTVTARTARAAIHKAPMPYRKYLGEIYADVC